MRKGFDGLAVLVQQVLAQNPHSGALFVFRGMVLDLGRSTITARGLAAARGSCSPR
jgi:transposase